MINLEAQYRTTETTNDFILFPKKLSALLTDVTMKTKDLNDAQLQSYFEEHVRYEIQLLLNGAWAISQQLPIQSGLEHMIVEAYAIHLRNLIDFFYPSAPHDDDVCAKYFFLNEGTWEGIRPAMSELLSKARKRAHKEVSHLTTSRQFGTPKGKEWDVAGFTAEIISIIEAFAQSADRIDLKGCCVELLSTYQKIKPHLV